MILNYVIPELGRSIIGIILLIVTFSKIFIHYRILPRSNTIKIENLLGNLFTAGIMIPIKGNTKIIKIINICVYFFYICLFVIFSQWIF